MRPEMVAECVVPPVAVKVLGREGEVGVAGVSFFQFANSFVDR